MKKICMMAMMLLMSIGSFAQDGKLALGVNLGVAAYGNSYNPFGIGVKGQYEFVENVRAEVAANYWLPKNDSGVMDLNLNAQYLIPIADGARVYPLAGVCLCATHGDAWKAATGSQDTLFGFNVGGGIEYVVYENIKINADIKYQRAKKSSPDLKYDGPVFQIGAAYCF